MTGSIREEHGHEVLSGDREEVGGGVDLWYRVDFDFLWFGLSKRQDS